MADPSNQTTEPGALLSPALLPDALRAAGGPRSDTDAWLMHQAADRIERLEAGWLLMLQNQNECDARRSGHCSVTPDRCACLAEMEAWMKDAPQ